MTQCELGLSKGAPSQMASRQEAPTRAPAETACLQAVHQEVVAEGYWLSPENSGKNHEGAKGLTELNMLPKEGGWKLGGSGWP